LYGFASRPWIERLLDPAQVAGPQMFGNTAHKDGDMVGFVKNDLPGLKAEHDLKKLIIALSAEAKLPSQAEADKADAASIAEGKKLIETFTCTDCHKYGDIDNGGGAPDLTRYGSHDWLFNFISDPAHEQFYGEKNDKMPSFFKDRENPQNNKMSAHEVEMLVEWLRGGK
jgi:hypothetical protein